MLVQPYDVPKVSSERHIGEIDPFKGVRKPGKNQEWKVPSSVTIDIDEGRPFY